MFTFNVWKMDSPIKMKSDTPIQGYWAEGVNNLEGCLTQGEDLADLEEMIREAAGLHQDLPGDYLGPLTLVIRDELAHPDYPFDDIAT